METYSATRIAIPGHVIFREIAGEAVILNLDTEEYYGLDEVGVRMWTLLVESSSMQAAYEILLEEYDVNPETLRQDLDLLVASLESRGLIERKLIQV